LGELLTSTGTKFREDVFDLTQPGFHNDKFPLVSVPQSFTELWKSAILSLAKNRDLGTSLGPLQNASSYEYLMDSTKQILFRYCNHNIVSCHIRRAYTDAYHSSPSSIFFCSAPAFVAEVKFINDMIHVIRYRNLEQKLVLPSSIHVYDSPTLFQFQQYLEQIPQARLRNIGLLQAQNWSGFLEYFRNGDIIAVADASVDLRTGCHSYILESKDEMAHLQGQAPVDADPDDMTSNRAERCGVLAILTITTALANLIRAPNIEMSVYCDNLEVLRKPMLSKKTYTKLATADTDLKMEISSILQQSPITYRFLHVKGHADEEEGFIYEEAEQEVRRNIDMDIAAKKFLSAPPLFLQPTHTPMFFPAQI